MDLDIRPGIELCDPLTGLYSRIFLKTILEKEVNLAREQGKVISLLLVDLDHFKSINDGFGHMRGDEVLAQFSRRLLAALPLGNHAFRYGGDEFVLLLPDTTKSTAMELAQKLLEVVQGTPMEGTPPISLSLSIGVSTFPQDGQTPDAIFEVADRRSYQAKRAGRGCAVGEDLAQSRQGIQLDPPRLLERELAQETLLNFIASWKEQPRSLLRISGASGCGQTRFLMQACQVARLRNYAVLSMQGKPALRWRVQGAVSEALWEWEDLPLPAQGAQNYAAALQADIERSEQAGLLIAINDWNLLDRASLDFLQELFFCSELPHLALIYADGAPALAQELMPEGPPRSVIQLEPLTPDGVRVWLRHSLKWEAFPEFVDWLHNQTAGYPALIRQGLSHLLNIKILEAHNGQLSISPDFMALNLHAELEGQSSQVRNNLPSSLPNFVGREKEIKKLKLLIQNQRMVTIIGIGGVGKSRLALQAAAECLNEFKDGVFVASLAGLASEQHLATAIGEALNFSFAGPREARTQLLNYLRGQELLLVLDNFDHLRGGVTLLHELLDGAPGLSLLVTSRERLELPEETLFELGELPYPEENALDVESWAAVQLFVRRARQARNDFVLTEADQPAIVRICRLVEGMPLAIELAAAWVQAFSCQEIATRVEQNLAFLSPRPEEPPQRLHSLMAMLDSFWELLSKHEQAVLRRLSFFKGGFSIEAAGQIAGASVFFLDALVNKTYLRRSPNDSRRYEIHELLRQYAAGHLRQRSHEKRQAGNLHCAYYTSFLEKRAQHIMSDHSVQQEVNREIDNLRAAWNWAVQHRRVEDIERGLLGLSRFYAITSLFEEGQRAFTLALEQLQPLATTRLPNTEHVAGEGAASPAPDHPILHLIGNLRVKRAFLLSRLARYDLAIEDIRAAIEIGHEVNDLALEAEGSMLWGHLLVYKGGYAEARGILLHARHLAQSSQALLVEANCVDKLGRVAFHRGDFDEAQRWSEQALELYRIAGDRRGEGQVLNSLGGLVQVRDDPQQARSYFEQFLKIAQEMGDRHIEAGALINLGMVSARTHDVLACRKYLEQAARRFHELGDRRGEGYSLVCLAFASPSMGDYAAARRHGERGLQLMQEIGERAFGAEARLALGMIAHLQGDQPLAQSYCREALATAKVSGARVEQADALLFLAHTQAAVGAPQAAETYQQAYNLRQEINQQRGAMEALAGLAQFYLDQGAIDKATEHAERVLAFLENNPTDGMHEPIRVYLTCYDILRARYGHGGRAAQVLETAYKLLWEWAEKIKDPAAQRSFLESVPSHRRLIFEYTRRGTGRLATAV